MKFTFKKYLIKVMLAIVSLYLASNIYHNFKESQNAEPVRIVQQMEEVKSTEVEYILTKEIVYGKLTEVREEVSLKGDLEDYKNDDNEYIKVDETLFGERHTQLKYEGWFKLGLDRYDVEIKHIDSESKTVYIKMPDPILISLNLPYDKVDFEKVKGFFRLSMSDDEKKQYYKLVEKDIENQLMNNKELMRKVDLLNKEHTREILNEVGVKNVIFE